MASIEITPHELVVRLHGLDRLLAARGHLTVPLAHVIGVRARGREAHFDEVIVETSRGVGTYLRGRVAAGSMMLADGRSFFDVHDPEKAVVIDLESEPYRHIAVQVDDEPPESAAFRIEHELDRRRAASLEILRVRGGEAGRTALAEQQANLAWASARALPRRSGSPLIAVWKWAISIGAVIALAPIGATALVFVAPAIVLALPLWLPMLVGSRPVDALHAIAPR